MAKQKITRIKPKKVKIPRGIANVHATLNNTIVTITDLRGMTLVWSSGGACGFKGSRKATPFAAQTAAESAGRLAMAKGIRQVEVCISGVGAGRETSIRGIHQVGLEIVCIRDNTPLPHNGCRPPKKRRV